MLDLWLSAVETLIAEAPGNDGGDGNPAWDATCVRLGLVEDQAAWDALSEAQQAAQVQAAIDSKFHYDYFEAEDVEPERPFFVLTEAEWGWEQYDFQSMSARGIIEVTYTEQARDPDYPERMIDTNTDPNAAYKRAKAYYAAWVGNMVQSCAERFAESGVHFTSISQAVPVIRTPRVKRDADKPQSDYLWTTWLFHVGAKS